MKKHLIALAVAGAVAAPAMAQNVTVYGTIDATVVQTDTAGTTVTTQGAGDSQGSSVIGLKGSEDLGGGMKASFVIEGDNEAGTGSALTFNRKNYIELSSAMGSIRLGRQYDETEAYEGYAGMGFNMFDLSSEAVGGKLGNTARISAPVGPVVVSLTNSNGTSTDGTSPNAVGQSSMSIAYASGAITAFVAQANGKSSNADAKTTIIGGGYKVNSQVEIRYVADQNDYNGTAKNYNTIGVSYALGNGLTAVGHYQKYADDSSTTTDYKTVGVALNKDLSKRTKVYIGYTNKDVASTGSDVTTTAIGLQHSF